MEDSGKLTNLQGGQDGDFTRSVHKLLQKK